MRPTSTTPRDPHAAGFYCDNPLDDGWSEGSDAEEDFGDDDDGLSMGLSELDRFLDAGPSGRSLRRVW